MSAVPKKKLCWNCEGNVSREIDNCPYCGVYLHSDEIEENSNWNPSYRPSSKTEEIPSPLYQIPQEDNQESDSFEENQEASEKEDVPSLSASRLFGQLKQDLFPILFLMMGSIFFLFGVVLFLFSENGTLTLQWQGSHALYFLISALPLIGCGWWLLQKLDSK